MIRIEREHPLAVLRELPDAWAQGVITGPPDAASGIELGVLLAVIGELARVTRPDATLLWSIERQQPLPLRSLVCAFWLAGGWQQRKSDLAARCGHLLFAKQPRFHWQPRRWLGDLGARRGQCALAKDDRAPRHRQWRRIERWRLERLLLAATTRVACGACGAPKTRASRRPWPGAPMRCGHLNPDGRSLLIDPFHAAGSELPCIAVCHGRSYLGIKASIAGTRR